MAHRNVSALHRSVSRLLAFMAFPFDPFMPARLAIVVPLKTVELLEVVRLRLLVRPQC